MKTFSKTDIGRKREVNQDYVFVSDQPVGNIPNLLIVADGMGGHNADVYKRQGMHLRWHLRHISVIRQSS